jgi:hypothetical protein
MQVHFRLLGSGLLPACLRVASTLHSAGGLAQHAARLLVPQLRLPQQFEAALLRHRRALVLLCDRLDSVDGRVAAKLRAVLEEQRKINKALALNIPKVNPPP